MAKFKLKKLNRTEVNFLAMRVKQGIDRLHKDGFINAEDVAIRPLLISGKNYGIVVYWKEQEVMSLNSETISVSTKAIENEMRRSISELYRTNQRLG